MAFTTVALPTTRAVASRKSCNTRTPVSVTKPVISTRSISCRSTENDAGRSIKKAAESVGNAVESVGNRILDGAGEAGDAVRDLGKDASKAADDMVNNAKNSHTAHRLEEAKDDVVHQVEKASDSVRRGADDIKREARK